MRALVPSPVYPYTADLLCSRTTQVNVSETQNTNMSSVYSGKRAFINLLTRKGADAKGPKLMFDTGTSVSLLTPEDFAQFKKCQLVRRQIHIKPRITDASGNDMCTHGVFNIQVFLKGKLVMAFLLCPAPRRTPSWK